MADYDQEDPASAAIAGRGTVYNFAPQGVQGARGLGPAVPDSPPDISARRQYLINQLPNARGRQARAIGTELSSINSTLRLQQQQSAQAEAQRRFEAVQGRLMAHDQAEQAAQGLKLDRERSIDEQGANLMTGLGQLDAMHRRGMVTDDQYDQSLLDLGQQNQLGLHHPVAATMFEHFITESDKRNAFNVRRLTSEAGRIATKYGVEPQVDPDTGLPSVALTQAAGLTTPKGKAELFQQMNNEMTQKYGVPTGVGSLFNPIAPHTSDDNNQTINLPFLDKQGKQQSMKVPYPLFNQMKADFQDRYNFATSNPSAGSAAPQVAQPQPAQQSAGGLQIGAQRTVGGQNYSWNGTQWQPQ